MSISDSDYQGRFTIPTPKGVYQAAGDTNINTDYAYRAENIRTERGLLASSYGTSRAFPSLGAPIETLARFYRRTRPDDADVYVAAAGGAIYTYTMGTEGWVKRSEGYKSDVWSFVTYEAVEGGATVDILILSNEKDGMIAVYGSDLRVERKTLTLGGSYVRENGALIGDLSAVLISQTPFWSGWFRAPKMETALIPDFDRKIEGICRECTREKITAFAGVPSWNLVLMRRVLEYTGKSNLLEVWPDLEFFAHGGVAFTPYRKSFAKLIPSEGLTYLETYNASEGFFALADDLTRDDMLLMLDYGTYYEFRSGEQIVPLEGVRVGEVYAMIVTSINGLWRYEIGDTVEFTSTNPYRIRFAGRTRQFINVFGEELIVDNAERALAAACEQTGAVVEEYSVAPCFMGLNTRGAHEWVLEFSERPDTPEHFAEVLDRELRSVNSDYDAKRQTALDPPRIHAVPPGTTLRWLQKTGKNKLPRMRNDRTVVEQLLKIEQ